MTHIGPSSIANRRGVHIDREAENGESKKSVQRRHGVGYTNVTLMMGILAIVTKNSKKGSRTAVVGGTSAFFFLGGGGILGEQYGYR